MVLPNGYRLTAFNIKTPTNLWIRAFVIEGLVISIEMNYVDKDIPWIIPRFERSLTQRLIVQMVVVRQNYIIFFIKIAVVLIN